MNIKKERSLVLIKPDGIQRSLIGEIIKRYERTGLKLVGIKMVVPTEAQIKRHYLVDPNWREKSGGNTIRAYKAKGEKPLFEDPREMGDFVLKKLIKYLSSSPVIAMVWQGMQAVGVIRKITGITEPLISDVGTIRGDLTIESYKVADMDGRAVRNLVHTSGSVEEAEKEIEIWFKKDEVFRYRLINEAMLYDVNLDGILE